MTAVLRRWKTSLSSTRKAAAPIRISIPKSSRAKDGFGPKVFTEENLALVEGLRQFAESRGHTLLELAMSWLAGLPQLASVIAGATKPEQVRANAAAAGWTLTDDERAEVDGLSPPR